MRIILRPRTGMVPNISSVNELHFAPNNIEDLNSDQDKDTDKDTDQESDQDEDQKKDTDLLVLV